MTEHIESSATSAAPTPPAPTRERHFGIGSLIIVPSLVVGLLFGKQESGTTATPATVAAPTPEAPSTEQGAPTAPATVAAIAPDSKSLKSDLEDLSAQLKTLRGQIDGLSRSAPAPDLKPLEDKFGELSKSVMVARPLLEKVDKLGGRIGDVGKQIESLQSDVAALAQRKSGK